MGEEEGREARAEDTILVYDFTSDGRTHRKDKLERVTKVKLKQKDIHSLKSEDTEVIGSQRRKNKEMVSRNLGQNNKHEDHSTPTPSTQT